MKVFENDHAKWALVLEYKDGKTLEQLMEEDAKNLDKYMDKFCKKSDTPKQYVQQWLPIVAASQLAKENALEKEFLMKWIDVVDYQ